MASGNVDLIKVISGLIPAAMLALVEVCKVIGASFLVVMAVDAMLRLVPGFDAASTRYNLIHALLNTYVVVSVVPDCYFVLTNPLEAMSAPYSDVPLATTIGLHLFHCVSQYKTLTVVDWAHHLVSNMLVSFLCFPFDCAQVTARAAPHPLHVCAVGTGAQMGR